MFKYEFPPTCHIDSSVEGFMRDIFDGLPIVSAILEWNNHTEKNLAAVIDDISKRLSAIDEKSVSSLCNNVTSSKYLLRKKDFFVAIDSLSEMAKYLIKAYYDVDESLKFKISTAYGFIKNTVFFDKKQYDKLIELESKYSSDLKFDSGDAIKKKSGGFDWLKLALFLFPPAYIIMRSQVGDTQAIGYRGWTKKDDLVQAMNKVKSILKNEIIGDLAAIADPEQQEPAWSTINDDDPDLRDNKGRKHTEEEYDKLIYTGDIIPKIAKRLSTEIGYLCRGVLVAANKVSHKSVWKTIGSNMNEN